MDINLPRKNGIQCVGELKGLAPSSKCIILTAFEDADLIFQALTAGALGYLLKGVRPARLLDSIREVHQGGSPMSSQIARSRAFAEPLSNAMNGRNTASDHCIGRTVASATCVGNCSASDFGTSSPTTKSGGCWRCR